MTRTIGLLAAVLLLAGCSRTSERAEAMTILMKSCAKPARVAIQFGGWNEHVRVECEVDPARFPGNEAKER